MSGNCPCVSHHSIQLVICGEQRQCNQTYSKQFTHEFCQTHSHDRKQTTMPHGMFLNCEQILTPKARPTMHNKVKVHCCHTFIETTQNHISTQQSRHRLLVPFTSDSASSGTSNSLSKVLFTFPSWYLFAIGLEPIFSLR